MTSSHTPCPRTTTIMAEPTAPAPAYIHQQPAPSTQMSLHSPQDQSSKPLRLRGGCIPCPVSSRLHHSPTPSLVLRGRKQVLDYTHPMLLLISVFLGLPVDRLLYSLRTVHLNRYSPTLSHPVQRLLMTIYLLLECRASGLVYPQSRHTP